jgi:aldose 1-epimerase
MADTGRATAEHMAAGHLKNGASIETVTLSNSSGISARILTYGATLQSLIAPDAEGVPADIVLGHDDVAGYEETRGFLGVTVGRYANRIAGGRFTLDGVVHAVERNDGPNSLHGGTNGFDRAVWTIESITTGAAASVVLAHVSPDGDGGFPGEVRATMAYTLDEAGDLMIAFAATTTAPTILNMTNHALFNLAGDGAPQGAMPHRLTIPAAAYTPVDPQLIPTGEQRRVDGTVFDFRNGRIVAEGARDGRDAQIAIGRGYDHNFVLDKGATAAPQLAARLEDPVSGRRVEVLTTEPGLQLYTGNSLDGRLIGKQGRVYRMGDGIALEPQKFPDTPNRPAFGSARVDPGQTYRHTMIYSLSTSR